MPYYQVTDVKLPIGFKFKDHWYDMITVREWTGGDNQYLVSAEAQQNLVRGISQFLSNIVTRVWNSNPDSGTPQLVRMTKDMASELYSGDRDMLILESRKLSYGNNFALTYTCTNSKCNEENSFDFALDGIETKYAESFPPNVEYFVELEKGIPSPPRPNVEEGAEIYRTVILTYLKGKDDEKILQQARINQSRAEIQAMFLAIKDVPGYDMMRTSGIVERLRVTDYKILSEALVQNKLGPDLVAEVTCYNCSTKVFIPLVLRLFSSTA